MTKPAIGVLWPSVLLALLGVGCSHSPVNRPWLAYVTPSANSVYSEFYRGDLPIADGRVKAFMAVSLGKVRLPRQVDVSPLLAVADSPEAAYAEGYYEAVAELTLVNVSTQQVSLDLLSWKSLQSEFVDDGGPVVLEAGAAKVYDPLIGYGLLYRLVEPFSLTYRVGGAVANVATNLPRVKVLDLPTTEQ